MCTSVVWMSGGGFAKLGQSGTLHFYVYNTSSENSLKLIDKTFSKYVHIVHTMWTVFVGNNLSSSSCVVHSYLCAPSRLPASPTGRCTHFNTNCSSSVLIICTFIKRSRRRAELKFPFVMCRMCHHEVLIKIPHITNCPLVQSLYVPSRLVS